MRKWYGKLAIIGVLLLLVVGLAMQSWNAPVLRVGVLPGMQADFMKEVRAAAAEQGMRIEVVLLQDYAEPNMKLARGDIDAVAFQPQALLAEECRERGFAFAVLCRTLLYPMGVYARSPGQNLAELPAGAVVHLPQEAVNGSRALRLLEQAGLIRLRSGHGTAAALSDIEENPRGLIFVEWPELSLPEHFMEADLTVMGTTLAGTLELVPVRDAAVIEAADSPYAQVVAVRQKDLERPEIQQLRAICTSERLRTFAAEKTAGEALAAF